MLHRARDLRIGQLTVLINTYAGTLLIWASWRLKARNTRQLIALLHNGANPDFPGTARFALQPLAAVLIDTEAQIAKLDKAILAAHRAASSASDSPPFPVSARSWLSVRQPAFRVHACFSAARSSNTHPSHAVRPTSHRRQRRIHDGHRGARPSCSATPLAKVASDATDDVHTNLHYDPFTYGRVNS